MRAPDVQFVAIIFADGSLGIMQFVVREFAQGGGVQLEREPTDEAIGIEIMRSAFDSEPVSWRRISAGDVPREREFRSAWTDDGRVIVHDLSRARSIHLVRLRAERDERLRLLDSDWMRATGQRRAGEADGIEAQRQALRDMPTTLAPALSAAQTIAELKAIRLP